MTSISHIIRVRYIVILLIVCVGLRMILFGIIQPWNPAVETQLVLSGDAKGYNELAKILIENQRFANSSTGQPDALRTPLYPMFIAVIYSLFGYRPWVVLLAHIVIDTMSCILLLMSLSRLLGRRVAYIASILYALDPFLILYSTARLYSETLFIFFLIAGFWFFSIAYQDEISKKTLLNYGLSSLFLGLATLTRPISQYLIVFFIVFLIVVYWKRPRIAITYAFLSLLIFGLMLFPWCLRNYLTFGSLSFSSSPHLNLLEDVIHMEVDLRHENIVTVRESIFAEADKMMESDDLNPQILNHFQKGPYWQELAVSYIGNNPIAFGKSYFRGIFNTLFGRDAKFYAKFLRLPAVDLDIKAYSNIFDLVMAFLNKPGAVGLLIIFSIIVLNLFITYLGAIFGLVTCWKRQYNIPTLVLTVLIAIYFIILSGPQGYPRFRFPSIPFYLAFTGLGINYLYEKIILAKETKKPSCA